MKLRNNKQLKDSIASIESENGEVRVDSQEQSVIEQNQTRTSENDRQRHTDLRSVELGTARIIDMMQIVLMFREMKEMQSRLEESIKDSQKEMQANIKEEFMNIRVENQRNLERLEYNITSPEGR